MADFFNRSIRKIAPLGYVCTFARGSANGSQAGNEIAAAFDYPIGVTVESANNVYVVDYVLSAMEKNYGKVRIIKPCLAGQVASGSNCQPCAAGDPRK